MSQVTEQERRAFQAGMAVVMREASDVFSALARGLDQPLLLDSLMRALDASIEAGLCKAGGMDRIIQALQSYEVKDKAMSLEELIESVR